MVVNIRIHCEDIFIDYFRYTDKDPVDVHTSDRLDLEDILRAHNDSQNNSIGINYFGGGMQNFVQADTEPDPSQVSSHTHTPSPQWTYAERHSE